MSFKELSEELSLTGYEFYRRGWVMGTSGNFSARISESPLRIAITASGNAKGSLDETHFLEIDDNADVLQGFGKPSAETMIHLTIYRMRPEAGAILHTLRSGEPFFRSSFIMTAQSRSTGSRCSRGFPA